jgi:O-antigen ligase
MKESAASQASRSGGASGRSWLNQALQNKIIAVVLAMIVAVPLFAAPADYSLTGIAALTLESFGLVLLAMMAWRAKWDLRSEQLRTFAATSANVPLLLFVGWVALSAALAPHKIFGIQYLLQIGAGALLYFAVAYQFRQSKHLSLLADALLFLALVVSIGGLAQYQLLDQERASALFGNAQPLASFVMLLLPVVVALAISDKNAKRQMVAQITAVLMVGCLFSTQGRSAMLGALAGLAVLALLSSRVAERVQEKALQSNRAKNGTALPLRARKHQFVLPGLLTFVAIGFIIVMNSQNGSVLKRASTLTQLGTDASWQGRLQDHWKGGLEMVAQRPMMGWGAGHFPFYQGKFTQMGTEIDSTGTGTRVSLAEQAHNFYLQTAAELGIVGLGLMGAVLVCFWISAWRKVPQMEAGIRRTLLMASAAASVGFAVDAFGSPSWHYAQNSMFMWLLLGVGTSCLRPRLRSEFEAAPVSMPRITWLTRRAAVGACMLMATLLPTAYSAGQQATYNPRVEKSNSERVFDVAFGTAAFAAAGYTIYYLFQQFTGGGIGNGGQPGGQGGTTGQPGGANGNNGRDDSKDKTP